MGGEPPGEDVPGPEVEVEGLVEVVVDRRRALVVVVDGVVVVEAGTVVEVVVGMGGAGT